MTVRTEFQRVGERLRRAVAAGAYEEAACAVRDLRKAAEEAGQDAELLGQALALLEWARRTTLAARAHDAARHARLRRFPKEYRSGPSEWRGPSVRVEG